MTTLDKLSCTSNCFLYSDNIGLAVDWQRLNEKYLLITISIFFHRFGIYTSIPFYERNPLETD